MAGLVRGEYNPRVKTLTRYAAMTYALDTPSRSARTGAYNRDSTATLGPKTVTLVSSPHKYDASDRNGTGLAKTNGGCRGDEKGT